jgi:hypothetical protein
VFNFNGLVLGNPVGQAHRVGIWDVGGSLLVSGTVGSEPGDTLVGAWEYAGVTPTILAPGRYVIGAQYTVGSPDWATAQPNTTDPALVFIEPRLGTGIDLPFPDQSIAGLFVGPNFQFTPVPEPAVGWLLLAGSGVMAFRFRPKRGRRPTPDRQQPPVRLLVK